MKERTKRIILALYMLSCISLTIVSVQVWSKPTLKTENIDRMWITWNSVSTSWIPEVQTEGDHVCPILPNPPRMVGFGTEDEARQFAWNHSFVPGGNLTFWTHDSKCSTTHPGFTIGQGLIILLGILGCVLGLWVYAVKC
jgi:hypothetical protein